MFSYYFEKGLLPKGTCFRNFPKFLKLFQIRFGFCSFGKERESYGAYTLSVFTSVLPAFTNGIGLWFSERACALHVEDTASPVKDQIIGDGKDLSWRIWRASDNPGRQ